MNRLKLLCTWFVVFKISLTAFETVLLKGCAAMDVVDDFQLKRFSPSF